MSAIHDLIGQIQDAALRERIAAEVDRIVGEKKFGLVFEDHIPESTPLYGVPVRRGATVARRDTKDGELMTVLKVSNGIAMCARSGDISRAETQRRGGNSHADSLTPNGVREDVSRVSGEQIRVIDIPVSELVPVARFGEAIYPYLEPMGAVARGDAAAPWHTLIEADNYHALQFLEYLYAGKVDCIYIDPPYNTGARDWKYNNDYVDGNDAYRHSKWLSMMQRRLRLAKRLLNPKNSVLIVTIDEKEYLHLGCLLEEMFPEARIQMVSTMINPAVVARAGEFGRCGEYIFFAMLGDAAPLRVKLDREWVSSKGRTHTGQIRWDLLKRSGTNAQREDRPNMFYPIFISNSDNRIVRIGEPLPLGQRVDECNPAPLETTMLWPIRENGSEGCWQWSPESVAEGLRQGRVRVGGNAIRGYTIYILKDGEFKKIQNGEFTICGRGVNNEIIVEDISTEEVLATPGDMWKATSHDATQYGSRLLGSIFGSKVFSFPKSLYAVHDSIRFFVADKPDALIVDFFAGSGTTLHAVNLLNAEDGGRRRCILVTNNEVSEAEAKALKTRGFNPGDEEWEELGIARHVTWPRTVCSIEGHDVKGAPLKGEYLGSGLKMADGFKANAVFFKLGFLDKSAVSLGRQFLEMLPTLWMKAGAHGPCPSETCLAAKDSKEFLILPDNRFAVLMEERTFGEFREALAAAPEAETVYLITDYEQSFKAMSAALKERRTVQLYRDYLDNFRINRGER